MHADNRHMTFSRSDWLLRLTFIAPSRLGCMGKFERNTMAEELEAVICKHTNNPYWFLLHVVLRTLAEMVILVMALIGLIATLHIGGS